MNTNEYLYLDTDLNSSDDDGPIEDIENDLEETSKKIAKQENEISSELGKIIQLRIIALGISD